MVTRRHLLAAAASAGLVRPALAQPVLRIAVEGSYPPFSDTSTSGELTGFDVDIARALCRAMDVQCELVRENWAVIQDAILGQAPHFGTRFDAVVASVSITATRRQTATFSEKYYHIPARFVRRQGDAVEISPAGLEGRTIGVQERTTHADFVGRRFGAIARIRTFKTLPQAIDALKRSEVDAVIADALALEKTTLGTKTGAGLEFTGPNFNDSAWFGEGVGVALAKNDTALRDRFNEAIRAIRRSGEYTQISERYFGFDIYGD